MIPYAEMHVFCTQGLSAYQKAVKLVAKAPSLDAEVRSIRCHELARAVATFLGPDRWSVVDGTSHMADHSWIVLHQRPVILDVYAVGQLPPVQLIDLDYFAHREQYREGPLRTDIREDVVTLLITAMSPPARVRCPTCRCQIVVGSVCACCISTVDADDPSF